MFATSCMARPMQPSPSESDLWQQSLRVLRKGVEMRKPDAIGSVKIQVEKLDNEIAAIVLRRAFVAGSEAWPLFDDLTGQLNDLLARMDDLRAIGDLIRATPLDHDHNCTPEAAVKANEIVNGDGEYTGEYTNPDPGIQDLNDELKRAASDIRHGWAVITQRAGFSAMGRSPGSNDLGGRQAKLAEQYYHWIRELHRKRIWAFPIDDVVCEGLSRVECAAKRRCRAETVYDQLVAGLVLYAETYPPLGDV